MGGRKAAARGGRGEGGRASGLLQGAPRARTALVGASGPPATCRAAPRGPRAWGPYPVTEESTQALLGGSGAGRRQSQLAVAPEQCPKFTWAFRNPRGPEGGSRRGGCAGLKQLGGTYNLVAVKKSSAHPCLALVAQLSQERPQETSLGRSLAPCWPLRAGPGSPQGHLQLPAPEALPALLLSGHQAGKPREMGQPWPPHREVPEGRPFPRWLLGS